MAGQFYVSHPKVLKKIKKKKKHSRGANNCGQRVLEENIFHNVAPPPDLNLIVQFHS